MNNSFLLFQQFLQTFCHFSIGCRFLNQFINLFLLLFQQIPLSAQNTVAIMQAMIRTLAAVVLFAAHIISFYGSFQYLFIHVRLHKIARGRN